MFGFGKGSIDILPEKFNYAPGDTIKGKVILKLKQAAEARELRIVLKGERTSTSFSGGKTRRQTITIHEFKLPLDGQKTYPAGEKEYSFEIKAPQISGMPKTEGALGAVLGAAMFLSGAQIRWFLDASLDMPGFDVSKRVNISIQ